MGRSTRLSTVAALVLLGCPAAPDPSMQSSSEASSGSPASSSDGTSTSDPTDASGPDPTDDTGPGCETCGGVACIDLMSDAAHCGACDAPCPAGIGCDQGTCSCPDGTMRCGDACVDVQADGTHCGGCDMPCDPGMVCLDGACSMGCGMLTECGGGCVDTDTSSLHCGGCDQPCPVGSTCEDAACACPGPAVSYANDIEPLFAADCTGMGCHGAPVPQEQLDLRAGSGYDDLVEVTASQCDRLRVAPGQPEASYLLDKLLGVDMCLGTRMPKAATPYSADRIELVTAWICQGAPP
jgi:hypothetical protein